MTELEKEIRDICRVIGNMQDELEVPLLVKLTRLLTEAEKERIRVFLESKSWGLDVVDPR